MLVVIGLAYNGWTLWSRRVDTGRIERAARDEEARRAAAVVRMTGGSQLKILSFYGSRNLLCYGVANAKTVRIEPLAEDIKPALSRCLEVHPEKDTEYKLVAEDAAGQRVEQSFMLRVKK